MGNLKQGTFLSFLINHWYLLISSPKKSQVSRASRGWRVYLLIITNVHPNRPYSS